MRHNRVPRLRGWLILLTALALLMLLLMLAPLGKVQAADAAWTGYYYRNKDLAGAPVVRQDPVIAFDWGDRPPHDFAWSGDQYSVRWVKNDNFNSGTYVFGIASDDGFRLYIDGALVLDEWRGRQGEWTLLEREMTAGSHRITVEYFEDTGRAYVQAGYYQKTPPTAAPTVTGTPPTSTPGGSGASPTRTPRPQPTPTPTLPFIIGTPGGIAPAVASAVDPNTGLLVSEDNSKGFLWLGFPGPVGRSGGNGGVHSYVKNRATKPTIEVRWNYAFQQAGFYDVYVFVPAGIRPTESALYRVFYGNQLSSPVRVDQARNENKWMFLGTYYFIPNTDQFVTLTNVTGERSATREILLDAVVFVLSE